MTFQAKTKVIKNIEVAKNYYKIFISSAQIAKASKPGQFIEIKASDNYEPFLRRPFSIHRVNGSIIEVLYAVVGKATGILSQKKPGEFLDVIGPLGNGFSYPQPATLNPLPILVAGGMGVAPLIFLADKLAKLQNTPACRQAGSSELRTQVLIGAKTKAQLLCEKEFKKSGFNVKIATDDGSHGFKGKVTNLLRHLLSTIDYRPSTIYACGPRPMLKEIAIISKKYNLPAQISLEEHMACGIGACLGCMVKFQAPSSKLQTDFEYKRVCKEGPVFYADEIVW